MENEVRLEIQSFRTCNSKGMNETMQVRPAETRRKKAAWYVWVKADGSGILVIDSQKLRVELPVNGTPTPWAPPQ